MNRYIAIWKGERGCDYSIGCGARIDDLGEHENMAAAIAAASTPFVEEDEPGLAYRSYLAPDAFHKLKSVEVLEIAATASIDLDAYRRAEKVRVKQEKEMAERTEYERLQRKFGGR